jgi:uncharacterized protein (DUF4213/DUF364 family)
MQTKIIQDTLERLESLYRKENIKPGTLARVGLKPGWNVVLGTDGQSGMAMSFTNSEAFGEPEINFEKIQKYVGKDLLEVTHEFLASPSWQETAIGIASLNALSQPLLTPEKLRSRGFRVPEDSSGYNSLIEPDDITAVVGYGGGISRLIGTCRELHVTDMRPRTSFQTILVGNEIEYAPKEVFVHPEKENKEVLERATVAIITGSSLVNGTFSELISYTKNARLVIVYGASAGMIPDVLLEQGVDGVNSFRVTDASAFEKGVMKEMNMESVIHSSQKSQSIYKGNR